MNASVGPFGKAVAFLLAGSLLLAVGPDVYGLDNCPFHGGHGTLGETTAGASDHGGGAHPSDGLEASSGPQNSQDQFCMWLVDCHACVESGPQLSGPTVHVVTPDHTSYRAVLPARVGPFGPRHLLFELHQPNAPPLTA
jgi:hypothetical protein